MLVSPGSARSGTSMGFLNCLQKPERCNLLFAAADLFVVARIRDTRRNGGLTSEAPGSPISPATLLRVIESSRSKERSARP